MEIWQPLVGSATILLMRLLHSWRCKGRYKVICYAILLFRSHFYRKEAKIIVLKKRRSLRQRPRKSEAFFVFSQGSVIATLTDVVLASIAGRSGEDNNLGKAIHLYGFMLFLLIPLQHTSSLLGPIHEALLHELIFSHQGFLEEDKDSHSQIIHTTN